MEKKKTLALKENQALEINQNLMEKVDQINLQEMEKKKTLALKGRKNSLKRKKQNHLDLQITLNTLEKNLQKIRQLMDKKKVLALRVRKNLKVEIVDLKTLPLKNTVKKEQNFKIF